MVTNPYMFSPTEQGILRKQNEELIDISTAKGLRDTCINVLSLTFGLV
jgi:hypothetical protein